MSSDRAAGYAVTWVDADGAEHELELQGELIVGRSSTCDLVLDDAKASRQHARLRVDGSSAFVEDLGSRNGTFVNGERVASADLSPGDEIRIGDTRLRLRGAVVADGIEETIVSAEGTVVLETQVRDPEATRVLTPVAPPALAPAARERGVVTDELLQSPIISEAALAENGVPVKVKSKS